MSEMNKRPVMAIMVSIGQSLKDGVLAHLHLDRDFAQRLAASERLRGELPGTAVTAFSKLDS